MSNERTINEMVEKFGRELVELVINSPLIATVLAGVRMEPVVMADE